MKNHENNWIDPPQARRAIASGDGGGVKVAIIDSGVEAGHPFLSDLQLDDAVTVEMHAGRPTIEEDRRGDVYGHGTAVAGIAHRLAPGAAIGSFRVLRPNGVPSEPSAVRAAAFEAVARGYQVINCSFGSPGDREDVLIYKDWIDMAYVAGVHVVTACSNLNPRNREWPSHFASLISVGIGDCAEGEVIYRPNQLVEFAAAGKSIKVPWRGNREKTVLGTSFAAPQVSAIVARVLGLHPQISPPLLKAVLREVGLRSGGETSNVGEPDCT